MHRHTDTLSHRHTHTLFFSPTNSKLSVWRFYKLPRWLSGKESTYQAVDSGSIPGSGRSPEEGNDNPLQYSCLGNPMGRRAWQATVQGVTRVRHSWGTKQQHPNCFSMVQEGHAVMTISTAPYERAVRRDSPHARIDDEVVLGKAGNQTQISVFSSCDFSE